MESKKSLASELEEPNDVDKDDILDSLSEEIERQLALQEPLSISELSTQFKLSRSEVEDCVEALQALHGLIATPAHSDETPESLGPYRILEEVGRGGMGVVYRAIQPSLGREVAVKVLRQARAEGAHCLERFQREAKIIARLNHPHIVTIHDIQEHKGLDYIVMDLIRGESLADYLDEKGVLSLQQSAQLTLQIAEALSHAHQRSVLHRDVKPRNVIFNEQGQILLTDFGLAKMADSKARGITKTGYFMGTLQYAAPEQVLGCWKDTDARADIYALGTTLYHMLTGAPPFSELPDVAKTVAIIDKDPPRPSEIRQDLFAGHPLEQLCLRCLEKDPDDRFQSVSEIIRRLRDYLSPESDPPIPPPLPLSPPRKPLLERPALSSLLIFLAGLLLGVMLISLKRHDALSMEQTEAPRTLTESWLTQIAEGEEGPQEVSDGVVIARLAMALQDNRDRAVFDALKSIQRRLRVAELELWKELEQANFAEREVGQSRLFALPETLRRTWAAFPHPPSSDDRALLELARRRLWLRRRPSSGIAKEPRALFQKVLEARQNASLGEGQIRLARLICQALVVAKDRERARDALRGYLAAEYNEHRAKMALRSLQELKGPRASSVETALKNRFQRRALSAPQQTLDKEGSPGEGPGLGGR